jgi:hypothetical protein
MAKGLAALAIVAALGCTAPAAVGGPCSTSRGCATGQACVDTRCVPLPDGGCGSGCECDADADCASAVPACVEAVCAERSCVYRSRDAMCPGGRCDATIGCVGPGTDAGAIRDAPSSADTAPVDGPMSLDAPGAMTGGVGAACSSDADCAPIGGTAATCLASLGKFPLPGGYCTIECMDGSMCGPDGECLRLAGSICVRRCSSDDDCRAAEGYRCDRVGAGSPEICVAPFS